MIETAILGLLTEGESHGYGIHRRLVEMGFWRVSFGSVYPALRRLKNAGAIEVSEDTDHKGRKLYRLTDQGRALLLTDLGDANSVDNSNAFRIRLTFLDLLGQQERLAVLVRRRDVLKERIEAARQRVAAGERSGYAKAEMEHRAVTMERDVEWVESLINQETKGSK